MSETKKVLDCYRLVKEARRIVMEAYDLSQEIEPDEYRDSNHPEHLLNMADALLTTAEKSTRDWVAAVAGSKVLIEEER